MADFSPETNVYDQRILYEITKRRLEGDVDLISSSDEDENHGHGEENKEEKEFNTMSILLDRESQLNSYQNKV